MPSSETARYLFINKAGKIVIDASGYQGVGSFSEGLAAVLDPRKGLPMGQAVIESFTFPTDDSDSELPADDSEFLVIDKSGKTLVNLNAKGLQIDIDAARFSEGLLGVYSPSLEAWGYFRKDSPRYLKASDRRGRPEKLSSILIRQGELCWKRSSFTQVPSIRV